ncbi:hypothetical protein Hdeb2414_s0010g00345321 [Helianthus debilis subsp. tardiflorus]
MLSSPENPFFERCRETLKHKISRILKDFRPEIAVRGLQFNEQEAESCSVDDPDLDDPYLRFSSFVLIQGFKSPLTRSFHQPSLSLATQAHVND